MPDNTHRREPFRQSLSARRAWIEIPACRHICRRSKVALRKESVDRNSIDIVKVCADLIVALRKESVDRNLRCWMRSAHTLVALRKESVDRNFQRFTVVFEIPVALRKESVDRNNRDYIIAVTLVSRSPQGERG